MSRPLIMTPGPTYIHEEVRRTMSAEITNPDLDLDFYEFYRDTCERLKRLLKTKNDVLILSGEGILGLEAACCSLIEPGDRVLCIDNGIFGKGFGDFAKMYGAEVAYYEAEYRKAVDVGMLKAFLEKNHDFKLATLVHCETPSGITNPINEICPLLNKYGIITVVDSVSAIGGEIVETDEWKVDIILGGSQKCLSAPPGLTFLSVSQKAWAGILNRKVPPAGFYCNLANWKSWYEDKWFPYTQPISDIYALSAAVDRLLGEKDSIQRHLKFADAVRKSITGAGLELYPLDGYSNTVTTVLVPEGINYNDIYNEMLKSYNIMIAGAFDYLKDKVFRIGHMGENCREEKLYLTLKALDGTLRKLGAGLKGEIHKLFIQSL